jgi:ferritin
MAETPSRNLLARKSAEPAPTISRPSYKSGIQPAISTDHNPLISEECIEYLNYRIQQEEYSSRIYLAMSMWLDNSGYVNAAKLWKNYSSEEMDHANWSRTYLLSMGVQPATPMLNAPNQNFSGLPEIIKVSFDHEITITMQIKDLASDALKKGDHMLYDLALKFLKEQVEEHNKMQNWKDQLKAFGEDKTAMRLLDHEMKDYL